MTAVLLLLCLSLADRALIMAPLIYISQSKAPYILAAAPAKPFYWFSKEQFFGHKSKKNGIMDLFGFIPQQTFWIGGPNFVSY